MMLSLGLGLGLTMMQGPVGSGPTVPIPVNTAIPVIAGFITAGSTLAASSGGWTNGPILSRARQWYQSDDGEAGWTAISGQTDDTYVLAVAVGGKYVRVGEVAANAAGASSPAFSDAVGPIELPAISGVSNFTRANNPKAIAAKAAMLAGSADMRIAYIGDSTVFGFGSDNNGFVNAKVHSVTAQLQALLTTAGVPASDDSLWGSGATSPETLAGMITADPRISVTGSGWEVQSFPCIGGKAFGVAGADTASTKTFTTTKSANRCDVYFLQFGSGGTFKFSVDGGAESAAQATVGAGGMGKVTLDLGTSAAHAVKFRCNDANVFLISEVFYDTNARRALIWNHGACGYTSGQINAKDADWDWGNNIANPNLGLHLAIIQGGLVNDRNAVVDPAASVARFQGWITALKAVNCDVWIVNPQPVADATTVSFAYRDALHDLANANSVPFIDLMTPHTTLSSWAGAGYDYDGTHPNGAGYGFIAARYAAMLEAL